MSKDKYEVWKIIEPYSNYLISNLGRVFSKKTNKILKPKMDDGYLRVFLSNEGKVKSHFIHKLIAQAFIPNPENKPIINHINSDRSDNRIENLEWCTVSENIKHGWKYGHIKGITGYTHTDEAKKSISDKKRGIQLSAEHKSKIANSMREYHANK